MACAIDLFIRRQNYTCCLMQLSSRIPILLSWTGTTWNLRAAAPSKVRHSIVRRFRILGIHFPPLLSRAISTSLVFFVSVFQYISRMYFFIIPAWRHVYYASYLHTACVVWQSQQYDSVRLTVGSVASEFSVTVSWWRSSLCRLDYKWFSGIMSIVDSAYTLSLCGLSFARQHKKTGETARGGSSPKILRERHCPVRGHCPILILFAFVCLFCLFVIIIMIIIINYHCSIVNYYCS